MNIIFPFIPDKKENKFEQEYVYAEISEYIYENKKEEEEKESVIVMQIM